MFHDHDSITVLEPASPVPSFNTSTQAKRFATQQNWLSQAIARHGPELWDRLVRSLPKNQADALREQLEAFVYELEMAEIEDD